MSTYVERSGHNALKCTYVFRYVERLLVNLTLKPATCACRDYRQTAQRLRDEHTDPSRRARLSDTARTERLFNAHL